MNKFLFKYLYFCAGIMAVFCCIPFKAVMAEDEQSSALAAGPLQPTDMFDDKTLINGFTAKLSSAPKELLLAMINDDGLYAYKKAAAVRVFCEKYATKMVSRERLIIEKVLLRQLENSRVVPLQIEIMHTLVLMDRFRYYEQMVPILVRKLDHYDVYVNELAYAALENINAAEVTRPREARIVFNALRKLFFLSRKKLKADDMADPKLRNKFQLLRWSIKILGTEELKRLPVEVTSLM